MKTAIIGLGNIGSKLAKNLAMGGRPIIVADKTFAKADALAQGFGGDVVAMAIDDAMGAADVIILAVYFDAIEELIASHHDSLAGKIVID